jgi:peptidoglycan/xylan/chitin deacetylase (PgdA/CDA1 family)
VGKLKSKPKSKIKVHLRGGRKQSSSLESHKPNQSSQATIPTLVVVKPLHSHRKKYWLLAVAVILIAGLVWYLSQSWLVRSAFSQAKTYPKTSIFSTNVGNLNTDQLDGQLSRMKSEFETHKITLVNDKKQWLFDFNQLGVTFDTKATSQAVFKLNSLSLVDKYRLMTGGISSVVVPTILVDSNICVKALSAIPTVQLGPQDASIYFDQVLKIKPDQLGSNFNATSTCRELSGKLETNTFVINVSLDTIQANLTKADLESKLPQVQSAAGKSLLLKNGSGTYQLELMPDQLLALYGISKKGSDVQAGWLSDKLDELVNNIAAKVNTNSNSPVLGACQYLSSNGGYWLDKTATKKIFTDIGVDSPRSYILPIIYHAPIIGNRTSLNSGSRGTIYLTYDDGLTYGDRIMNYVSCYGIKVTFFELGSRVGVDAAPLRRAIAEGHAVQSHGYEHAMYDYGQRSYDWQYNDISQSITAIMSVTGVRPTYFRPPGGNRSDNTYAAAGANGVKLILWGASSADSTAGGISSSQTCANVLAGVYPGASVLMHSIKQTTAEALPCIAEGLAARGYNMQALR